MSVQLNGSRTVTGTLRGYDVFLNITMADALEHDPKGEQLAIGTIVIRGNSIVSVEVCFSIFNFPHFNFFEYLELLLTYRLWKRYSLVFLSRELLYILMNLVISSGHFYACVLVSTFLIKSDICP